MSSSSRGPLVGQVAEGRVRRAALVCAAALLLLASGGPARAQFVILVPDDAPTIQDAIWSVGSGDIIEVAPGTYHENLFLGFTDFTLRSTDGAATTIIDATGSNQPALNISGVPAGTLLQGFTIRGGSNLAGLAWGGGLVISGSELTIEDCVIANNIAESGGGAAIIDNSEVTFDGCTFRANTATSGGGAAYVNNASATFVDCVLRKNTANSGGGVNVNFQGEAMFSGCRIQKNTATNAGGGVIILGSNATGTLTNCTIEQNQAAQAGGVAVTNGPATISGCDFLNNVSTSFGTGGGGMLAQGGAALSVSNSRFTGNQAQIGGGAQLIAHFGPATFTGCEFSSNDAGQGGGFACTSNSTGTLTNCTIENNTAFLGAGVYASVGTSLNVGTTQLCGNLPDGINGAYTNQGGNSTTPFCTGWTNLGYAVAGSNGVPSLTGTGTLSAGFAGSLNLGSARPSSLAVLFVSFAKTPTPFFSGTLLPVPPQLTLSFTTSPSGSINLPFTWPAGLPAGFDVYHQFGISDPGAVDGVALSNALQAESL